MRASAAVGAPAGRATSGGGARPIVGGRADLGPNDFFGGLLANVSLGVEGLPPTEAEVKAEWRRFWAESPCDPSRRPPDVLWLWLVVAFLTASLPVLLLLAVPRYRRKGAAWIASLCALEPPPEEIRCDGDDDNQPGLSRSNTFTSKVSKGSFEICCSGSGGGSAAPPRPQPLSWMGRIAAVTGSGSNNFRVASSAGGVTIRSNREAAPGLL